MLMESIRKLAFGLLAIASGLLAQTGAPTVLKPADLAKLLPPSVYYRGQTAPIQLRNACGVRFADGSYVLASLVDTSGYSSGVAAKYQGYFIAEVPLKIEGKRLAAGVYGIGFVDGGKFIVTDVGGHELLNVNAAADHGMKRPKPLQMIEDPTNGFRLYAGRQYVRFAP